jgi:hypothetical protein
MTNRSLVSAPSSSISRRPQHSVLADADMLWQITALRMPCLRWGSTRVINIHHMRTRWVGAVFSNTTYPMKQTQPVLALAFLPSNRLLFRM